MSNIPADVNEWVASMRRTCDQFKKWSGTRGDNRRLLCGLMAEAIEQGDLP